MDDAAERLCMRVKLGAKIPRFCAPLENPEGPTHEERRVRTRESKTQQNGAPRIPESHDPQNPWGSRAVLLPARNKVGAPILGSTIPYGYLQVEVTEEGRIESTTNIDNNEQIKLLFKKPIV